jgi:hypothetical protein
MAESATRFLDLTTGATYVVDERPEGQERGTMLLVHGATVPHWEFDRLAPFCSVLAGGSCASIWPGTGFLLGRRPITPSTSS